MTLNLNDFDISTLTFSLVKNTLVFSVRNRETRELQSITIFHTKRSWYVRTKSIWSKGEGYANTYSVGLNLEAFLKATDWIIYKHMFRQSLSDCGVSVNFCETNTLFDLPNCSFGPGKNETELPLFQEVNGYQLSEELFGILTKKTYQEARQKEVEREAEIKNLRRRSTSRARRTLSALVQETNKKREEEELLEKARKQKVGSPILKSSKVVKPKTKKLKSGNVRPVLK